MCAMACYVSLEPTISDFIVLKVGTIVTVQSKVLQQLQPMNNNFSMFHSSFEGSRGSTLTLEGVAWGFKAHVRHGHWYYSRTSKKCVEQKELSVIVARFDDF